MSVRAYKLIEIKHADEPTFNCWHDQFILDLANNNDDNLTAFDRSVVVRNLESLKSQDIKDDQDKNNIEILEHILKDMADEEYVEYFCF